MPSLMLPDIHEVLHMLEMTMYARRCASMSGQAFVRIGPLRIVILILLCIII